MENFILIDLESQFDEVSRQIEGHSMADAINWLCQFGAVTKLNHPYDDRLYVFRSNSGVETAFRFTETNQLAIIKGHTIKQPNVHKGDRP